MTSGTFGNSGRNILRGPDWQSLDLSLQKSFPVRRANRNLRWDVFNVFNTATSALPERQHLEHGERWGRSAACPATRA